MRGLAKSIQYFRASNPLDSGPVRVVQSRVGTQPRPGSGKHPDWAMCKTLSRPRDGSSKSKDIHKQHKKVQIDTSALGSHHVFFPRVGENPPGVRPCSLDLQHDNPPARHKRYPESRHSFGPQESKAMICCCVSSTVSTKNSDIQPCVVGSRW